MTSSVAAAGGPTLGVATHAWPWATSGGTASSPDEEELRDFCSLLSLADRVLIASPDGDATAARLLCVVLEDLGFIAQVVDARTIRRVQRYDTVVAVCAAEADPGLIDLLRPALQARAVLLAVTASRRSALLPLADAAVTVSAPAVGRLPADRATSSGGFDLRLIVAVDAIRRDLDRRRRTPL
jgi:DNA-binding MurR/RpiR family transcriptional regulator